MALEVAGLKMYQLSEVADLLGCSYRTVRSYIKTGRLRASKIGRRYCVEEGDLRDFLLSAPTPRDHVVKAPRDYREQMKRVLALAKLLHPAIRAGTLGKVDAVEAIHAVREERMKQILGD